jgi:hypothetical protein
VKRPAPPPPPAPPPAPPHLLPQIPDPPWYVSACVDPVPGWTQVSDRVSSVTFFHVYGHSFPSASITLIPELIPANKLIRPGNRPWDMWKQTITEIVHRSDSHSRDEVIPFPRITSSVNAGFPVLLSEFGRQNHLAVSKSYVFSHLFFQTLSKPKLSYHAEGIFLQHY